MNRKIKVLHVLKSSLYSGAENVAITIINNLKEDFNVVYLATKGEIEKVLIDYEVPYVLLNKLTVKGVGHYINKFQPDIVHAHDFTATFLCTLIPGKFRLISHLHYDPPWACKWNLKTIAYLLCYKRISKLLTVSQDMFYNMVFCDIFKNKLMVVNNPLDIEGIKRKAVVDNNRNYDIIFVGRFVEQKNPQCFIRVIKKLVVTGLDRIQCVMLGDGELLKECQQMVEDLQLTNNIKLLGFQSNPYLFMKRSALMINTSRWEGYGLVIAEANILGIPVLANKTSGALEIFGGNSWEVCVDENELVEKAYQLMVDNMQYKKIKEDALNRVKNIKNIEDYMFIISSIYINEARR